MKNEKQKNQHRKSYVQKFALKIKVKLLMKFLKLNKNKKLNLIRI